VHRIRVAAKQGKVPLLWEADQDKRGIFIGLANEKYSKRLACSLIPFSPFWARPHQELPQFVNQTYILTQTISDQWVYASFAQYLR
jgi:hypothetical protein